MDPFSHALVGATFSAACCRKKQLLRLAALTGFFAGMTPDLDIFIRAENNPMFGLGFHRHFTHSLLVAPFIAALFAGLVWLLFRKSYAFATLFAFALPAVLMHGMLDSMTNYGTHLFWPFTNRRESWSVISIIDPIFTLTLLALLIAMVVKRARGLAIMGVCFAGLYWSAGYYQRFQATQAMEAVASERGHGIERMEVKPALGNILVWRAQYEAGGLIYTDAFHTSPWRGVVHYPGASIPRAVPDEALKARLSAPQWQDVEYFNFFSDGWIAYTNEAHTTLGDMRFAMLPNQQGPLWQITLSPDDAAAQHVTFENIRNRTPEDVKTLWRMIQGKEL